MDIIFIILGAILIIIGFIGAFLPVIPGLPLSYAGLLILQLLHKPFSLTFMIVWAGVVLLLMFLDNAIPAWVTKKYGGSKPGITGSILGMFAGLLILQLLQNKRFQSFFSFKRTRVYAFTGHLSVRY